MQEDNQAAPVKPLSRRAKVVLWLLGVINFAALCLSLWLIYLICNCEGNREMLIGPVFLLLGLSGIQCFLWLLTGIVAIVTRGLIVPVILFAISTLAHIFFGMAWLLAFLTR